ncbi:MAG: hypothetical protein WC455_14660 [Dehalococcoidia bacterium]
MLERCIPTAAAVLKDGLIATAVHLGILTADAILAWMKEEKDV